MRALTARASRHAALADVVRLAVVDELVLGDRSPSELQSLLAVPSNLLAHHLKVLECAGLVARRRSEGDRRRTYLTLLDPRAASEVAERATERVVFVCSGGSARSQLASALWRRASDVPATATGTRPAESVAEGTLAVAERRSLPLPEPVTRRHADVVTGRDLVVAVCDHAYEELRGEAALHWSVPDPVGRDAHGFDAAFAEIERRVATLAPAVLAG